MQLYKNSNWIFWEPLKADCKIHLEKKMHGNHQRIKKTINKSSVSGIHTIKSQQQKHYRTEARLIHQSSKEGRFPRLGLSEFST